MKGLKKLFLSLPYHPSPAHLLFGMMCLVCYIEVTLCTNCTEVIYEKTLLLLFIDLQASSHKVLERYVEFSIAKLPGEHGKVQVLDLSDNNSDFCLFDT